MPVTRYQDGGATVTLDSGLEDFVRRAIGAANSETVRILEEGAGRVAVEASANWYASGTGVEKDTGKSGDIQVITTISRDEVKVSVGSTDTTPVNGKPRAVYIHRPNRLSLVKKQVTVEEYWLAPKAQRANYHPLPADSKTRRPADVGTGPFLWVLNPKASDGKYLVTELVRKPMRLAIKTITPEIARAIAKKIGGGR
jgi:hypothetical protein